MSKIKLVRLSILLISLNMIQLQIFPQQKGILRGVVKDSTNSEALPFGNVIIKELNIGSSTNDRGYFVIPSLTANKTYKATASYIGYLSKTITVQIIPDEITDVEFYLVPSSIQLGTVEKIGTSTEENNSPNISKTILTPRQIEAVPKGVESDVLRSLKSLPGVQSAGDVSARFNVRGGETNQNIVLIDNIPIYYPFHAVGLFSVIDPDIINSIEFYKGGYPAEYGRAISSVLKIATKDGNKNNFGAKLGSSFLSSKGMVEGPLPGGSFFITGRKSISNVVLKSFVNENELPVDFYDASFKVNFSIPGFLHHTKLTLQGLFSEDNLTYPEAARPDYKWRNQVWGLNFFTFGSIPFFTEVSATISSYQNQVIPKESDTPPKFNKITDFSMSADFLYVFDSKDEIGIGLDFKLVNTELLLVNRHGFQADVGKDGIGADGFIKYKFLQFDNLGIDIGTRLNLSDIAAKGDFLEPRFSFNYIFSPLFTLKGSYGIFQQELTTLIDEREVLSLYDPMVIIPEDMEKAKAIHYILGLISKPQSNVTISVEGYYKDIVYEPVYNTNKIAFEDPELLPASGDSYGVELYTNYTSSLLDLAAAYTLSWSHKIVEEEKYYPRYDTRHALNLSAILKLPYDWQFSINWTYNSGYPFTQQIGFYDRIYLNDILENNNIYKSLYPFLLYGEKNSVRLPDYHRLDLSLGKNITLPFIKLYADLSIVNVYDRKNIFYFDQNTGDRVNMLPFLLTCTLKVEL